MAEANSDLTHRIAEDMLPLPVEKFFTAQRAPDMWFSDELPPTYQDCLNDPRVQQARWTVAMQIAQVAAQVGRQEAARAHADKLTRAGRATRRRSK